MQQSVLYKNLFVHVTTKEGNTCEGPLLSYTLNGIMFEPAPNVPLNLSFDHIRHFHVYEPDPPQLPTAPAT